VTHTVFSPAPEPRPAISVVTLPPLELSRSASSIPLADGSLAALEETAVRRTLERYATAYGQMDISAAAEVWPAVDRRALSRAFGALKSQKLTFNACNVALEGATALAQCRGTLEFVRKFGSSTPRVQPQQWSFRMRKVGTKWTIDDVAAAPLAESSDQRVR
jgi:hypothetical protein